MATIPPVYLAPAASPVPLMLTVVNPASEPSEEISINPVALIVQPYGGIAWLIVVICVALLAFIWRKKRS